MACELRPKRAMGSCSASVKEGMLTSTACLTLMQAAEAKAHRPTWILCPNLAHVVKRHEEPPRKMVTPKGTFQETENSVLQATRSVRQCAFETLNKRLTGASTIMTCSATPLRLAPSVKGHRHEMGPRGGIFTDMHPLERKNLACAQHGQKAQKYRRGETQLSVQRSTSTGRRVARKTSFGALSVSEVELRD